MVNGGGVGEREEEDGYIEGRKRKREREREREKLVVLVNRSGPRRARGQSLGLDD